MYFFILYFLCIFFWISYVFLYFIFLCFSLFWFKTCLFFNGRFKTRIKMRFKTSRFKRANPSCRYIFTNIQDRWICIVNYVHRYYWVESISHIGNLIYVFNTYWMQDVEIHGTQQCRLLDLLMGEMSTGFIHEPEMVTLTRLRESVKFRHSSLIP